MKVSDGGGGEAWAGGLRERFAAPDVVWTPPMYGEAALNRAYEAARVFVYPSLAKRGETFGLAVLEAMAWGAVPVVSDLACFRDLVAPGRNGFIFDHRCVAPGEALLAAIKAASGEGARSLAEEAVRVRETHSLAAIAEQFLADFARVT
jgi:glycosyltransferase involved in cell wall biosynthesis